MECQVYCRFIFQVTSKQGYIEILSCQWVVQQRAKCLRRGEHSQESPSFSPHKALIMFVFSEKNKQRQEKCLL